MQHYRLTVGSDASDIVGFTNAHIQCAVDRVALLGGGVVELSEGVFNMADSLHLRTLVAVRGQGEATILRKNAMKKANVATFLGYGHDDIVVDDPGDFELGDGIIIGDDRAGGFYLTVGTLIRREGDTWYTTHPHVHDYLCRNNGIVRTLFPIVSAVDIADALVEDLVIEGNSAENETLNGCRGGGFFAHRAKGVVARRLTVHDFDGDGFSFQTCDDLELDGCVALACTGNGFHPGSGSNRFHIHDCKARECGNCGLYYCLRVRDSLLENCTFERNGLHGVSIGARDTGHTNRSLVIRKNGGAGVYLRPGGEDLAAHDNCIEDCLIEANCADEGEAEIVLQGETRGISLIRNTILHREGKPGILIKPEMLPFEASGNTIEPGGESAIVDQR
jgi:hypothetical protein